MPRCANLVALERTSSLKFLSWPALRKRELFLRSHKVQIPNGNMIPQLKLKEERILVLWQFNLSQSTRLVPKKRFSTRRGGNAFHRAWASQQSLRQWRMVSRPSLQIGYVCGTSIPLVDRTSWTGMLWWRHFQRKYWILGIVATFQIHSPSNIPELLSPSSKDANLWAFLRPKSPFGDEDQEMWSKFLSEKEIWVALISKTSYLGLRRKNFANPNLKNWSHPSRGYHPLHS